VYISRPIDPKSSARQRDAERTRAALLIAARTLFSTRGFANTGVREVAELAGVNSSLVGRSSAPSRDCSARRWRR